MDKKKVLIVEDDRMLSAIFQMFIRDLGHELIGIVSEGQEALEHCRKDSPDIILMDIHIRGEMDGVATSQLISENFEIPVIYVTGDYEGAIVPQSILSNTYGFLVKPLYKSTLGAAIEYALCKHELDKTRLLKFSEQQSSSNQI